MKNRLAYKLAFVFLLLALIPLLIFGSIAIVGARRNAVETISVRAAQEARQAAARIEDYIEGTRVTLVAVADNVAPAGLAPWQIASILDSYVLHLKRFLTLALLNGGGQLIYETPNTRTANREWPDPEEVARQTTAHGAYRSKVHIEDYLPYLTLALPVPGREGRRILVAELSLLAVWDVVETLFPDNSSETFLVSDDGRLIAHSDPTFKPDIIRRREWTNLSTVKKTLTGEQTILIEPSATGQESFLVGVPLKALGWALVVEQSTSVTFASLRRLQYGLAVTVMILIGLIALSGYLAGHRLIMTPMKKLIETTRHIGTGDFTRKVGIASKDEFGQLGAAFEQMTDQLREYKTQVETSARVSFLGRVAAGLAHDLKHPIANIKTMTGLLATKSGDAAFLPKYQRLVNEELTKASRFLDDLHNLSKPSQVNKARFNLTSALKEWTERLQFAANEKRVSIESHIDEAMVFDSDAFLLERIVSNLALNAIQAVPDDGSVEISGFRRNGSFVVRVADNGPGIPADRMKTIFDDFATTKKNGLGLGLPIAKKFTEELGGNIEVQSQPGSGTVFEIAFDQT